MPVAGVWRRMPPGFLHQHLITHRCWQKNKRLRSLRHGYSRHRRSFCPGIEQQQYALVDMVMMLIMHLAGMPGSGGVMLMAMRHDAAILHTAPRTRHLQRCTGHEHRQKQQHHRQHNARYCPHSRVI